MLTGEKVTTFEDHTLWHPDCNTNNIYITSQQDLIISYCKQSDGSDLGSINVRSHSVFKCFFSVRALLLKLLSE